MRTISNVSGRTRQIAATGQSVEPGGDVDIDDDDLAAALLEQPAVWATPKASKSKSKTAKSEGDDT